MSNRITDLRQLIMQLTKIYTTEVMLKHAMAIKKYRLNEFKVSNYEDFRRGMTDFVCSYMKEKGEYTWTKSQAILLVENIFKKKYVSVDGCFIAYYIAKTNLNNVINILCEGLNVKVEDKFKKYISRTYMNSRSERLVIAQQYIDYFSKYLPSDILVTRKQLAKTIDETILAHIKCNYFISVSCG